MDKQQTRLDGQETEPVVSPSPRRRVRPIPLLIRWGLIAVVFAAVSALIYMMAKREPSLISETQQQLFPLLSGLFIGGLTVLWLYHQTASNDAPKAEPKPWFFPVLGGALTLIIAVLAYICLGLWPVGEKSAMIMDMYHQYAPMFAKLRDMLLHGGSPLYSFEIGAGASVIPLFAYYLVSPFNALIVLFPLKYLTEGILVITLIKMTLIGALMTLCLQCIFKRRCWATVVAGIMYSLSMYVVAYSWNIMWLDCVMSLPLCVIGFERLMRTGKYPLYVLSLAYTMFVNYYIGFMVCIFLTLYYMVYFFREVRTGRQQAIGFGRFALGSLLGGGLAMIILVPVVMSLSSTSAAAGSSMPGFETNFAVFDLIGRGLFQSSPTIRSRNLPNLYCGVLAVLALPIFATMKSIPLRRRLSYLGLFGVIAISLVLKQADLLWHGLHSPNDMPYRYSFLYCFVLALITFEVLRRAQEIRAAQLALTVAGIALYLIVEEKFGTAEYSSASLYVSFALIAVYALIMLAAANKRIALRCAYMLMLVFVSAELLFNTSATFQAMDSSEHYTKHETYLDNEVTDAVIASLKRMQEVGDAEANGAFYRMEFLPRRTMMDTAMFNYRGITVFASSGSHDMYRFMGSMGYEPDSARYVYRSFVPTSDSLMGIKYVALKSDLSNHPQLKQLETIEVGSTTYYIYENPYALPLGFMAKSDAKDWTYSYYNPMLSQNSLLDALTGNTGETMQCMQITTDSPSVTVNDVSAFRISGKQTVTFRAVVSEKGQIYIHVDCRAAESISVTSGSHTWSVNVRRPYTLDAGTLEAGSEVTVEVTSKGNCTGNVFVARLNEEAFEQNMADLAANGMTVTSFSDTSVSGTVHADEAGVLCTTVPYDVGWTVKVDGQQVETFAVGGALLAVDLEPGDHEITMSFFPRGLIAGIAISAGSLVCLVVLLVFQKRRGAAKGRVHA